MSDYIKPCPVEGCTLAVVTLYGVAPEGVCPVHGHKES